MTWRFLALAALGFAVALSTPATSSAQTDLGPRVEKTYGEGLPRDRDLLIFDDDQYPVWPLTPEQRQYAGIDGARMKQHVIALAHIGDGCPARPPTAKAVWVGVGARADFIGRDVEGKAVVIYSVFVPGGRSHSASDRAGLFNANTRAVAMGAAMVVNVMGVPGNSQFQPEGGMRQVPQFTLSMDEGFALRDRLGRGERVELTFQLDVEELRGIATEYTIATLPGVSDEQIVVMSHTDGYFQAATDNAAGMASALELARFFAKRPRRDRPRTMRFILFPDHHHGEVARGRDGVGINDCVQPFAGHYTSSP